MISKDKLGSIIDFTTKNFLLVSVFLLFVYSVIGYDYTSFYLDAFDPTLSNCSSCSVAGIVIALGTAAAG